MKPWVLAWCAAALVLLSLVSDPLPRPLDPRLHDLRLALLSRPLQTLADGAPDHR